MLFYTSCVRSVTEDAIPAFYNVLPLYLKNELRRIEERSISIITGYNGCGDLEILRILEHYEILCQKLFKGILYNPRHKLKALLPPIHYFPIVHNALCLPPKFCINYCCEILLGGLHIPKSIQQQ